MGQRGIGQGQTENDLGQRRTGKGTAEDEMGKGGDGEGEKMTFPATCHNGMPLSLSNAYTKRKQQ